MSRLLRVLSVEFSDILPRFKIAGTTPLKMTDFKIEPATFIIPAFKTSEDITIKFEWLLGQRKPAAAAAK